MKAHSAGILATAFGGSGDAMQKGSERAVSPQEAGSGLDGKPRATEEPPGTEDMFGGLTLTGAREGNSLI